MVTACFSRWGFGISLPSEFAASHKAPEQNPDLELFKSPDLLSVASSSTAFICCNIVKASSCETWLAVCASKVQGATGTSAKALGLSVQLVPVGLIA